MAGENLMMIDNSRQIPAYRCESQLSNWGAPGAWQGPTGFGGKFSLCGSRIVLRLIVKTRWGDRTEDQRVGPLLWGQHTSGLK